MVSVYEAKTHFSQLIMRVMSGEEIVVSRAGRPVVRIVPYEGIKSRRVLGQDEDAVKMSADFDAPLPEDILAGFES